jgi:hypothetical protein
MSAEARSRFLPDSEYKRTQAVDVFKLASAAKVIADRYQKEVG